MQTGALRALALVLAAAVLAAALSWPGPGFAQGAKDPPAASAGELAAPEVEATAPDQPDSLQADPPQADPADADRGKKLYLRYCRGCHGADGRGGGHTFMPHVDRLTEKGYIDLLPDEYLHQVITEGGQFVGKSGYMPAWKTTLSDRDIADVIAHIRRFRLH